MGSIVLNDKDKRFDCSNCLSGKDFKKEGRDEAYVKDRIKSRLISKGCTSDTKNPVIRLQDGGKIYRCPKAICDDSGSLSAYSDYSSIRDGLYKSPVYRLTWKWNQTMQTVRAELASNERERYNDITRKSKLSAKGK